MSSCRITLHVVGCLALVACSAASDDEGTLVLESDAGTTVSAVADGGIAPDPRPDGGSLRAPGSALDARVAQDSSAPTAPSDSGITSPSGQAMPTTDLPGWKLVFSDDFTVDAALGNFPGAAYGAKWSAYPDGYTDTSKNGKYSPAKTLSVKGGVLGINVHSENGIHYVSAPLPMKGAGQLYGRYSVRFRTTQQTSDYKTAWLLWPDSNTWPADGEIDFPEGNLNSKMSAFAHHANPSGGQDAFPTNAKYDVWHTATTEWAPGSLSFYIDGAKIGTSTTQVPSKAMHYVMQTETNLDGVVPSNASVGNVEVDWVVIWSRL